jgi:UDP-N-acetylmuramate dehydrogenase
MIIKYNVPLAPFTSYKIGGRARELWIPETPGDVLTAARYAGRLIVLGGGTNTLFGDGPIDAAVLKIGAPLDRFAIDGETVRAEAGAGLAAVARAAGQAGLTGLEWAAQIPGTVGGAVAGNAGAFGGSMSDVVKSVTAATASGFIERDNEQCAFTYRGSAFKNGHFSLSKPVTESPSKENSPTKKEKSVGELLSNNAQCAMRNAQLSDSPQCTVRSPQLTDKAATAVVTEVVFALRTGDKTEIRARADEYARARRERQPAGLSAGSVFKAAGGVPAGLLIDRAGLKGVRVGGAAVSEKHANFILNEGGASFADVKSLIDRCAADVWLRYGIRLETEIRIVV